MAITETKDPLDSADVKGILSAPDPASADPLDKADLSSILGEKKSPAASAYESVADANPDHVGKVISLSDKTGQHPAYVANHLPQSEAEAAAPAREQFDAIEQNTPKAAKVLSDPATMAMTKDQLDHLPALERLSRSFHESLDGLKNSAAAGIGGLDLASMRFRQLMGHYEIPGQGFVSKDAFAAYLAKSESEQEKLASKIPPFDIGHPIRSGVYGTAQFAPTLAALGVSGLALGPAGPPMLFGMQTAGDTYGRLQKERLADGKPISDDVARLFSVGSGVLAAGLTGASEVSLAKNFLPKLPGGQALLDKIFAEGGEDIAKSATFKAALWNGMKDLLKGSGMAGATMAAFNAATEASIGGAKLAAGEKPSNLHPVQSVLESVGAGVKGAVELGPLTAFGAATGAIRGYEGYDAHVKAAVADITLRASQGLQSLADASKLAIRNRPRFEKAAQEILRDTPMATARVPLQALEAYFQSGKVNPEEFSRETNSEKAYQDAIKTGDDVEIQTHKIIGTPYFKDLVNDVKYDQEGLTPNEAAADKQLRQGAAVKAQGEQAALRKQAESDVATVEKGDAESQKSRDAIALKLNNTFQAAYKPMGLDEGERQQHIEAASRLWASNVVEEAKRKGITADEAFDEFAKFHKFGEADVPPQSAMPQTNGVTIYSIHHGQTDIDAAGVGPGPQTHGPDKASVPLNEQGRADAQAAAEKLAAIRFSKIISADNARARETGEAISDTFTDPRLNPIDIGDKSGMPLTQFKPLFKAELEAAAKDPNHKMFGRETFGEYQARVLAGVNDAIAGAKAGESIGLSLNSDTAQLLKLISENGGKPLEGDKIVRISEKENIRPGAVEKLSLGGRDILEQSSQTPEFKKWFKNSKATDKSGNPARVFHGTGGAEGITKEGFSHEFTGRGNDQFGAGFYFTDNPTLASGYTERRIDPTKEKIGGEESAGVIPAFLSLQNPFIIDGTKSLEEQIPILNAAEIRKLILAAPGIKNPDGPLSNYGDVRYEGFEKVLKSAIDAYKGQGAFAVANDFYSDGNHEKFLRLYSKMSGHDGVIAEFPSGEKHYVAWFPEQIKSVFNDKPTDDPNILKQESANAPTFYSKLQKDIEAKLPERATVGQVQALLREAKEDERKWSGIDEFLKGKDKISKPELLGFLKANQLEIKEVEKGAPNISESEENIQGARARMQQISDEMIAKGYIVEEVNNGMPGEIEIYEREGNAAILQQKDIPADINDLASEYSEKHRLINEGSLPVAGKDDAKFGEYQLPGGQNYRELLLRLPKSTLPEGWKIEERGGKFHVISDLGSDLGAWNSREDAETSQRRQVGGKGFFSSHFDEPNILAHVRFNDRVDSEGKKVLFLEEVQSDWHQKGRRQGYQEKYPVGVREDENVWVVTREDGKFGDVSKQDAKTSDEAQKYADAHPEIFKHNSTKTGVPDAPFKKTWHEFALKRMIRYAAENGYDKIGWTTGEQQAERYDLSKQVDSIHYESAKGGEFRVWATGKDGRTIEIGDHPVERLPDVVGKDLADKIISDKGKQEQTESDTIMAERGPSKTDADDVIRPRYTIVNTTTNTVLERDVPMLEKDSRISHWVKETSRPSGPKTISGVDLKIGGEGMKGFYDKIIPSFLNKFGKKFGAEVGNTKMIGQVDAGDRFVGKEQSQTIVGEVAYLSGKGGPGQFVSPITGERQQYAINRVSVNSAAIRVWSAMKEGYSFGEAMAKHGTSELAKIFGGRMEPITKPKEAEAHFMPITPEMKRAALKEGFPLFQSAPGEGPRGFYDAEQKAIAFMKNADPSTLLHEPAHHYIQATLDWVRSGNANKDYLDYWEPVKKWLDVKDDQNELTRAQQEKFAEALEGHFMRDKEIPESLSGIFARFRQWLTGIYQQVRGGDIPDEVHAFMNRMFAGEDEVQKAIDESGYKPSEIADLPDTPEASRTRVRTLQERARAEAEDRLISEQLKEIKGRWKEWMSERKEEAQKAAEAEVKKLPTERAKDSMKRTFGKNPDYKSIAQDYIDGNLPEDQQVIFETGAQMYNFDSGDALAKQLVSGKTFDEEVNDRVKKQMDQYQDLKDTSFLRDMAREAVHSEKGTELLALEQQILEDKIRGKEIAGRVAEERRVTASEMARAAKQEAQDMLADMPASKAGNPRTFITAEKNAAVKVSKALAAEDFEAANKAKQQQMFNHAAVSESLKLRNNIGRWERNLADARSAEPQAFKSEEHFLQVNDLLHRFGLERNDYLQYTGRRKETLAQWEERMGAMTDNVDIADWLKNEATSKNYKDMTVAELRDLRDAIMNIRHVANGEDKAESIWDKADLREKIGEMSERAATSAQNLERESREKPDSSAIPWQYKFTRMKDGFLWNRSAIKVETDLRLLQEFASDGPFTDIYNSYSHGKDSEGTMLYDAKDKYKEIFSVYSPKEMRTFLKKAVFIPELNKSYTKADLLMMLMNRGNDQNLKVLAEGRGWTPEQVHEALIHHLDKRDFDTAQNVWNWLETYRPKIGELYKKITGFEPQWVDAKSFDTPYGTYRGGYFPLKMDPEHSVKAFEAVEADKALNESPQAAWRASTKNGFVKERNKNARYMVSLDIGNIHRHVYDVVHDLAMRPWVLDAQKVFNNPDIQSAVRESLGQPQNKKFMDWVRQEAGQNGYEGREWYDKTLAWMRQRTMQSVIVDNMAVLAMQTHSLFAPVGADPVNFGWAGSLTAIKDSLFHTVTNPSSYGEKIASREEKSPYMKLRGVEYDRDLNDAYRNSWGARPINDFARKFTIGYMKVFDHMLTGPIWDKAYDIGINLHKGDEQKAVDYADGIIRRSQVGGSRLGDLAPVFRNDRLRTFAMIGQFFNNVYNMAAEEGVRFQAHPVKNLPEALSVGAALYVLPVVVKNWIHVGMPDDEEKKKEWLKGFLTYPAALVPFNVSKSIADHMMNPLLGIPDRGWKAGDVSPAFGMIDDLLKMEKTELSDRSETQQKAEAVTSLASYGFGYPRQFNSWFWNIVDYVNNGMNPKVEDVVKRRPARQRND